MKKRILIITLLLAVGAFALAGCSRRNAQNSSSATQKAQSEKVQTSTSAQSDNTQNSAATQSENTQNSAAAQSENTQSSAATQSNYTQNSAVAQSESTQNSTSAQSDQTQNSTRITEEEARRLALDRVPGATENDVRIHLEYDDGIQVYDGEITYNQKEYDFEINADTGEFIEWSEDVADYLD